MTLEVKNKAIGILLAGKTLREVEKMFEVTTRTVKRWWRKEKHGESQEDKKRTGRPKKLTRVAKIVIAKSLAKKRQSNVNWLLDFLLRVISVVRTLSIGI